MIKIILLIFFLNMNCATFIAKLPFTDEARNEKMISWDYTDFSNSPKYEEHISDLGTKYLNFLERKHDTRYRWFIKVQHSTLDQMIIQNSLRKIFYKKEWIWLMRLITRKGSPNFTVAATSYDEFFKIEINKIPHYFTLVKVSEDTTLYYEIVVIRKGRNFLEILKTPLLKKVEEDKKIGNYTLLTNFEESKSEAKEFVLDSFKNLKTQIEKNKVEFEQIDFDLIPNGFTVTKFEKGTKVSDVHYKFEE